MAQTVDTVAHNQAHGAGVVIRPDTFRAVSLLDFSEFFGNEIERCVPRDVFELAGPLHTTCAATDAGAAADGAPALHNVQPWRRRHPRCNRYPAEPCTRPIVRSSSNSTSSAQVDGQSCGQAEWPIRFAPGSLTVWFIALPL